MAARIRINAHIPTVERKADPIKEKLFPRYQIARNANRITATPAIVMSTLIGDFKETSRTLNNAGIYNCSPAEARGDFPIFCAAEREELDGHRRKGEVEA